MKTLRQPSLVDEQIEIVDDRPETPLRATRDRWKVLVVDDDPDVHAATRFVLGRMELLGRPLDLIEANNSHEAQDALLRHRDIAVILLDVVMEEHDSGLKFARWVREAGQHNVRIILRTGQPGYAPELDVIRDYDINDYRAKSELTQTRLITSLTAAIRSFQQIETIERSRRGLEMIVASCSQLFQKRELASFSHGVLMQIASLCGVRGDGLICSVTPGAPRPAGTIVSGLGALAPYIGRPLADLPDDHILKRATERAGEWSVSSTEGPIVLSVNGLPGRRYVASLDHDEPLDVMDTALLSVFSSNIAVGFENVGLIERLDRLAFWDEATGLPSRNRLLKDLDEPQPGARVVLVRVLSYANALAAFGQGAATELIKAAADALSSAEEPVYRFGEDCLAVVAGRDSRQQRLVEGLADRSFAVCGQRVDARIAIGCADLEPGLSPVEHCDRACAALSRALAEETGGFVAFEPSMIQRARDHIEMMAALRDALESDALDIVFQPIVDVATGDCVGFEALARWEREGHSHSPTEFIPLAEQAGLTLAIFASGVRRGADLLRSLGDRQPLRYVSVNLSPYDLSRPGLVPFVVNLLARTGLPPASLQVEITEESLIHDISLCERNLAGLKSLGCRIAIDDFGTGYSCLSYIGRLPVHVLKVDRKFVAGLLDDRPSQAIITLTQNLAQQLGLHVVAEGVETPEQHAALREIGCCYGQGYLFAKPLPAPAIRDWLDQR